MSELLLDLPLLPRDSRLNEAVLRVRASDPHGTCGECRTHTWPMGRDLRGQRREQCLHCGQRYIVMGEDQDDDDDDNADTGDAA